MYVGFKSVASTSSVKTVTDLATVPAKATSVELQAVTNPISYTMDDATDPSGTAGMMLLTTSPPKEFSIDDLRRIRFIRVSGDGVLNCHYIAGRNI